MSLAQQLSLDLAPPKTSARQRKVIDRLHAVLRRRSITTDRTQWDGVILLRPILGSRMGYETLCSWFAWTGDQAACFERRSYVVSDKLSAAESRSIMEARRAMRASA